MMWMYAVRSGAKGRELYAIDMTSLKQLNELSSKVKWLWVDIFNPDEKECEIISELFGNEPAVVENIKCGSHAPSNICGYERRHDYVMLHAPFVTLKEELKTFPIFIIVKKKMLVTWGEEEAHGHSTIVKSTIRRLREYVEEGEKPNSPLAIAMLLREIACKNSDVMLSIKELIDNVEERVLETGEKPATRSIFALKRKVHKIYRLLINEREFLADVHETLIPRLQLDEKAKSIIGDAIEVVDRELGFIDSYDRALDSVLTLQDLTSIHKVESSISYLTIILVVGTVILIILEIMSILGITGSGH